MKDRLFTLLKIAVSLGLIAYLFTRVDLAQVSDVLRSANYWYLLPATLLYLGAMSNAGLKWYILLRAQGIRVPFRAVLSYTYVGFFFNNFLPANVGGDLMRGYGMARYTEQAAETAVSVVVDRIVGLMAFMSSAVVAALVAIYVMDQKNLQQIEIAAIIGLVIIAAGFGVILSRRVRGLMERIFAWKLLTPFAPIYSRLSEALNAYRHSYGALALAFCISLLTLVLTNFTDFLIVQSLGGGIPLIYIFLFNPIIAFVLLVPISVGGLGVTQAVYPFFYGLVGVPSSLAFTVSLLKQLIIYITSLPGGVLWWRRKAGASEAPAQPERAPT
ncbi:MAG: flippase-like domain-containing protein [Anaerolineales bacterium]|nr:MAG: flippase-like domain-containing protein [Anaerolineales bacterium]